MPVLLRSGHGISTRTCTNADFIAGIGGWLSWSLSLSQAITIIYYHNLWDWRIWGPPSPSPLLQPTPLSLSRFFGFGCNQDNGLALTREANEVSYQCCVLFRGQSCWPQKDPYPLCIPKGGGPQANCLPNTQKITTNPSNSSEPTVFPKWFASKHKTNQTAKGKPHKQANPQANHLPLPLFLAQKIALWCVNLLLTML